MSGAHDGSASGRRWQRPPFARKPRGAERERDDGSAVVALEAQVEPVPAGVRREEQVVAATLEDDLGAGRSSMSPTGSALAPAAVQDAQEQTAVAGGEA